MPKFRILVSGFQISGFLDKKRLQHLLALVLLLNLPSCTEDFSEINTNPNAPTDVQPSLLLRQVLWDYGERMSFDGFVAGNLLSQHFAEVDFNRFDRGLLLEPQFGGDPWPIFYQNLRDNEIILQKSRESAALSIYEGPALILKAYMAGVLTDMFGDVPYFQAVQGRDGIVIPAYDSQEDIYLADGGILDNLRSAVQILRTSAGSPIPLEGDILFNGDLASWERLANSLLLKSLLRISARVDVSDEMQALFDEGSYMTEGSQDAAYNFTAGPPNNFRMATARVGDFNNFVMSRTADSILAELNDPRIDILFRPAANTGEFNGLPNGIDPSQTSIVVDDFARPGTLFREETDRYQANFLTAWETHFVLAEAAQSGLIQADWPELYRQAVRLSFDYWGASGADDYLAQSIVDPDLSGNPAQLIATQRWVASLGNGYEPWIEWRRTGFPQLLPIAASLNNDLIPIRFPYPTDEQALNLENFTQAAAATDGNSPNVPVWWDME
ncbi:MAG: SusD/RagB family nutrient-binding outer membrane lipoprotein [Bacteroidota bacterium]